MFDLTLNEESLAVNLDLVSEFRDKSMIREAACKIRASRRYNTNVWSRSFKKGDLVWRMRSDARKNEGKFSPTGRDLSESKKSQRGGAYHLKWLGQDCTEDVECHAPQVLLQLNLIKSRTLSSPYRGGFNKAFSSKY